MGLNMAEVVFMGQLNNINISFGYQIDRFLDRHAMEMPAVDVLAIETSSNDILAQSTYMEPLLLAERTFRLARKARRYGVKRVIVMQVLFRRGQAAWPRWRARTSDPWELAFAEAEFNDAVVAYNRHLNHLCNVGDGSIVFRRQRGLHVQWKSKMASDGVHLNPAGMSLYYRNMRSALIKEGLKARAPLPF